MVKKKVSLVVGVATIAAAGLLTVGYSQKVSSNSADKSTLKVATSGTLYPTSYHDSKSKKLTGYDIEVVRAVAKKMDAKLNLSS